VFFSDDHGKTWSLGGTVDRHTNQCQVVELADGALLINMRNYWGRDGGRPDRSGRRAVARSRDGGATWSPLEFDATLIDPVCQASLIAMSRPGRPAEVLLVFSNPASTTARRALTVRVSGDGGKTWPVIIPVEAGPAAYSCLAPLPGARSACSTNAGSRTISRSRGFRWCGPGRSGTTRLPGAGRDPRGPSRATRPVGSALGRGIDRPGRRSGTSSRADTAPSTRFSMATRSSV
jgi:hypothetical protein